MTQIDPNGLAAVIRRQVSSLANAPGSGVAAVARAAQPARARSAATDARPDIAALVARRVLALDPSDPDRPRKAFRVFLESVLLAEFGDDLINDAGFHRLVESVHEQMSGDADLAQSISQATTRMLRPATAPGR